MSLTKLPLEERHKHTCPRCIYVGSDGVVPGMTTGQRDWYVCPSGWTDTNVVCRLSSTEGDFIEAPSYLTEISPFIDEAVRLGVLSAPRAAGSEP